jgi:chorismate--pyruvate lyase
VRTTSLRQALWHPHVNRLNAPAGVAAWLTAPGSLTARLTARSGAFRVQRLHQRLARCLFDEAGALGLAHPGRVWEREVLLRCDGAPVVFAHTVVRLGALAADWPRFNGLGERSLGSTLFHDPLVRRGALEFARLRAGHPLMRRARAALGGAQQNPILYARRCVYRRRQGSLLVTEVFLPAVLNLRAPPPSMNLNTNTNATPL